MSEPNFIIPSPALRRVIRRAGVKRISATTYEELRLLLQKFVKNIVRVSVLSKNHSGRKTVNSADVEIALPVKSYSDNISSKKVGARNAKKNSVAKDISHFQQSEGLLLPRLTFSNLVRHVTKDYDNESRYSKNALLLLQTASEDYLVNLVKGANVARSHANRKTLNPQDLTLIVNAQGPSAMEDLGPQPPVKLDAQEKLDIYIRKIAKQVMTDVRITKDALSQLNFIANRLAIKLGLTAREFSTHKTLGSKDIEVAVHKIFREPDGGNLKQYVVESGRKSVSKYSSSESQKSRTAQSGLTIPPSRIRRLISSGCKTRMGFTAAVYAAGVIEYVLQDLIYICKDIIRKTEQKVIKARVLEEAFVQSLDLKELKEALNMNVLTAGVVNFRNIYFKE